MIFLLLGDMMQIAISWDLPKIGICQSQQAHLSSPQIRKIRSLPLKRDRSLKPWNGYDVRKEGRRGWADSRVSYGYGGRKRRRWLLQAEGRISALVEVQSDAARSKSSGLNLCNKIFAMCHCSWQAATEAGMELVILFEIFRPRDTCLKPKDLKKHPTVLCRR